MFILEIILIFWEIQPFQRSISKASSKYYFRTDTSPSIFPNWSAAFHVPDPSTVHTPHPFTLLYHNSHNTFHVNLSTSINCEQTVPESLTNFLRKILWFWFHLVLIWNSIHFFHALLIQELQIVSLEIRFLKIDSRLSLFSILQNNTIFVV